MSATGEDCGTLAPAAVIPHLRTVWLGRNLICHASLSSTSDEAARLAAAGAPHGTVVLAEEQTAGRGRRGRGWHSPPGENLHLSLLLRPALEPRGAPPLSLAAAVAVAEGVRDLLGRAPIVKWPNDLLLGGRKFCGILLELTAEPGRIRHLILGLGVNVNARGFPPALAGTATSLALESGAPLERRPVLLALLERLERWIDRLLTEGPGPIIQAWLAYAPWIGGPISVETGAGRQQGVARGLDGEGALLLRRDDGREERILAGDLHLP